MENGYKKDKGEMHAIEFKLGSLEFEAKGSKSFVSKSFKLLLATLQDGKLPLGAAITEMEEEVEEMIDEDKLEEMDILEPPPKWDSLDTEEPPISDIEKETR